MAHSLIIGTTGSGKTTLAIELARAYKRRKRPVLVLDPFRDARWRDAGVTLLTDNPEHFMRAATRNRDCALFIDESGKVVGRYNDDMFWLATDARHYGHSSHFIAQRAMQLSPTVRDQCEYLFLFRVSRRDAKLLAEEYTDDSLLESSALPKGEYFFKSRFGPARRQSVTLPGRGKHNVVDISSARRVVGA
jgi:energy-coupling factor transporter ATP-binding protein EcfA2